MNTSVNSPELIIFPPGKKIATLKKSESEIIESGHIQFENRFNQPLPTLVEAFFNKSKSAITVKVLFFVNSKEDLTSVTVRQLFSISNFGNYKLQFFLSCKDEKQAVTLSDHSSGFHYKSYTAEFTTNSTKDFPEHISLSDIEIVQTFIWDIDPKTSRGTETTVQTTD
ncbi:hypothetical protein [uncultured Tenacibaculum sp.]|uniref:hypothetical protein n=1 Tax=uncultured Tenacibaculum sp. TaxID=174713 RepID=UPI00263033B8|nr:hypothetical protein [uncultured Tenacibaculum sp.]